MSPPRLTGTETVVTSYDSKHTHDWSATLDGYEPGDPIGWGETEEEAVADLMSQFDDEEETT